MQADRREENVSIPPAPSIARLGRYEILGHLAQGGTCDIYRARLTGPAGFERVVALKRLRAEHEQSAEMVQLLCEEAKISATLPHPNITQVLDFGFESGVYYLVLEFVDGTDLEEAFRHLRRVGRPIAPRTALAIAGQMLAGLRAAHERQDGLGRLRPVVHRDMSPGNVMLSREGFVKITDFGLARPMDRSRQTNPGVVKGKFPYLTPEQTVDLPVDPRSDLFQVGIVLWETLTGRALFKRANALQTILAVREAPIPAPSSLASDIPPGVDALVAKALARDPDERYQSAAAFRRAIDTVLHGHEMGDHDAIRAFVGEVMDLMGPASLDRPSDPGFAPWVEGPGGPEGARR